MLGLVSTSQLRHELAVYTAKGPRFTARVSGLVPDDFIVMDGKTGRQVMNGKGVALVLDTMDDAVDVAQIMNERVATLPTAVTAPRDEDNDGGYDSDDYPSDPPALLSTNPLSSMRGLFG